MNGRQHGQHGWGEIPSLLRERQQWIVTKNKKPKRPGFGWNQEENTMPFHRACKNAKRYAGKIAYVLQANDPYVIFDLDDVALEKGTKISQEALSVVERLDTYTEWSQSGNGLHLVCKGSQLPDRQVSGLFSDIGKMEVFDAGQYIILTGDRFGQYTTINNKRSVDDDHINQMHQLQKEYLTASKARMKSSGTGGSSEDQSQSTSSTRVTPADIRRTIEEYARDGREYAQRTQRLWNSFGDVSDYKSPSEADMAFIGDLTYWCREDRDLIDKCFRESSRLRPKWDEEHYHDGRTYGEATIDTAIRSNTNTFSSHYVRSV